MDKRDQGEEMIRAADRFAEAAERLSASLDRFLEFQRQGVDEHASVGARGERLPGELILGFLGAGEMPDEEAAELASEAVHRARKELGRDVEADAPSDEEIARWWRNGDGPDGLASERPVH